jgi:TPR repeat protein
MPISFFASFSVELSRHRLSCAFRRIANTRSGRSAPADHGDADAQANLGVMYATGEGVPQDHVLAHMWFNLAAAQGNDKALRNRDTAGKRMTPDQLAEAQRMAREWKPKPAR